MPPLVRGNRIDTCMCFLTGIISEALQDSVCILVQMVLLCRSVSDSQISYRDIAEDYEDIT